MRRLQFLILCAAWAIGLIGGLSTAVCRADKLGEELAAQVTIHRDQWGVPHIEAPTDSRPIDTTGWAGWRIAPRAIRG